jgi:hypothetical protein
MTVKIKVRAGGTLVAYTFVKNSAGTVVQAGSLGDSGAVAGVIQQALVSGEVGDMVVSGLTLLKSGFAIAPFEPVTSDGNGFGRTAASTNYPLAQYIPSANEGAAASTAVVGDLIEVIVYASKAVPI